MAVALTLVICLLAVSIVLNVLFVTKNVTKDALIDSIRTKVFAGIQYRKDKADADKTAETVNKAMEGKDEKGKSMDIDTLDSIYNELQKSRSK